MLSVCNYLQLASQENVLKVQNMYSTFHNNNQRYCLLLHELQAVKLYLLIHETNNHPPLKPELCLTKHQRTLITCLK